LAGFWFQKKSGYGFEFETVIESLTKAMGYRIEPWDGYIVAIAKAHSAPIIYTLDERMKKRVKDLHVINPILDDVFKEYNEWLEKSNS